ncbi:MAG: hypothetical protein ACQEQV_05595 [Fibrobacterota bacterium]
MKQKRIAAVLAALLLITAGCGLNQNTATFVNSSEAHVTVHFRADTISLAANGGAETVEDIPKGTYSFDVKHGIPAGIDSVEAEELAGALEFSDNTAENMTEFVSHRTTSEDDDGNVITVLNISTVGSQKDKTGALSPYGAQ